MNLKNRDSKGRFIKGHNVPREWVENNGGECGEEAHNYKHGNCGSRLYGIWLHVRARIYGSNAHCYKWYGGRGVKLCPEWDNYIVFRDWALSNGYNDNLTIDRVDNNGHYEPKNCQWITRSQNSSKAHKGRKKGGSIGRV